jgi:hypothetical protein
MTLLAKGIKMRRQSFATPTMKYLMLALMALSLGNGCFSTAALAESDTAAKVLSQSVSPDFISTIDAGNLLPAGNQQADDQDANKPGLSTLSTETSQPAALEAGTRFPVVIDSSISSKTAQIGEIVEAHLDADMIVGSKVVAKKGALVKGHIRTVQKARKVLKAELSRHRWLKSAGELGVQFDEIVTDDQEHLPLLATPARQARFVKDMQEGRVLGINDKGEIVSPLSSQLKSQGLHWGVHIAVTSAGIAGGPIGLSVMPAAFACLGAINPSFAFMHPVGKNMKHRRLKGFALGFVSGVPGGGLVVDAIVRGPEAIIEPGDIFDAELKQEFKGEPSVLAQNEPAADAVVHGEIVPSHALTLDR